MNKLKVGNIIIYVLLFALSFIAGIILTEMPHRSIATETVVREETEYTPTAAELVGDKININTASVKTLQTIEGIGEKLSERIVEYRTQNGKFQSIENIMDVSGIGKNLFEDIKHRICAE